MSLSASKYRSIFAYVLMAMILYFVFLLHLSSFHIRTWDESIYAVEAYEMIKDGKYFVPHNNGAIDYMHAKPLLAVWLQVLSIKILGYNELAIRMPSAIASMLTCLLIFFFIKKYFNERQAWCSFLVLSTSLGFVHFHTSRTGDTDAPLTLFLLASNIFLFKFLADDQNRNRNIYFYFLFLALAFLTKSFAALLFVPAHIFILIWRREFLSALRTKGFYLGLLTFLTLSIVCIAIRQHSDPAYLNTIMATDFSRMTSAIDNHKQPFEFYFNNFIDSRLTIWLFPFLAGIILLSVHKKESVFTQLLFLWTSSLILTYFLIISISSTKLEWYDMPLYPYTAISGGYAIFKIAEKFVLTRFAKTAFFIAVFSVPMYSAFRQSYANSMTAGEYLSESCSEYLFDKENSGFNFNNYSIADTSFNGPYLFFKYKVAEKNQNISVIRPVEIKESTKVIVSDINIKNYIRNKFSYVITDTVSNVTVFDIRGKK